MNAGDNENGQGEHLSAPVDNGDGGLTADDTSAAREQQDDVATVAVGTAFEAGLASALGGVRGLIDSGVPSLVFVLDYLLRSKNLAEAVIAAVAASLLITAIRFARKEPIKQALSGLLGVAFSAGLAYFTGQARNYFVTGIALNGIYGTALLASIVMRRPALGYISSALAGDLQWRTNPQVRRKMYHATWLWVGVFYLRIALQMPLYLSNSLGTLGVMKIVLGWPLYLLAAAATWAYLRPHRTGVAAPPTAN
jgi:hypothetical protein